MFDLVERSMGMVVREDHHLLCFCTRLIGVKNLVMLSADGLNAYQQCTLSTDEQQPPKYKIEETT